MSGCFTPGTRRRGANRKGGGRRSALRCWSSALGASVPGVGGRCRGGGCRRSVLRCRSSAPDASVSGVWGWYRDAGRRREVLRCPSSKAGISTLAMCWLALRRRLRFAGAWALAADRRCFGVVSRCPEAGLGSWAIYVSAWVGTPVSRSWVAVVGASAHAADSSCLSAVAR